MTINYRYDLHVHTAEVSPCGKVGARQVVEMYKDNGYKGIVITDHFYRGFFYRNQGLSPAELIERYYAGYELARELGEEVGLVVLPGMEIKFDNDPNDYLVYGIDRDFLQENIDLCKRDLNWLREKGKDRGILIYQAHPYRDGLTRARPVLLDGVEVFNGNPRHLSRNELAYQFAVTNNLKKISGSDFHQVEDLGRGGIITAEMLKTEEDFLETLRQESYQLLPRKAKVQSFT